MAQTEAATAERRLIQVDGPPLGHIPSFDGIRGFFVLQVVMYHAELTDFLKGTPIVIDWFFVASGFLITTLLLDEQSVAGSIDLRKFYSRRVLRLFPAMYAMVALFTLMMIVVRLVAPTESQDASLWWAESLGAGFYVYFIVAAFLPGRIGLIGHTWSLTVEEQFYFFWPPVLRRTLRRASRRADVWLVGLSLLFIVGMIYLRVRYQSIIVGSEEGADPVFADEGNITWQGVVYRIAAVRPDMIVWGCLMAFVARRIPRPVPDHIRRFIAAGGYIGWALFLAILVFGAPGPQAPFALFGGPIYQVALLFVGPIVLDGYFRQESWYSRIFSLAPARWLGLRAYGIYLWHVLLLLPLLPAIQDSYGVRKLLLGLVASALGIGAGLLSFRYIERRFLRIKALRFASPAKSAQ